MLYSKTVFCFKMAYYCCFSFGGNLDFPEWLQKSSITSTTVMHFLLQSIDPRCHGWILSNVFGILLKPHIKAFPIL